MQFLFFCVQPVERYTTEMERGPWCARAHTNPHLSPSQRHIKMHNFTQSARYYCMFYCAFCIVCCAVCVCKFAFILLLHLFILIFTYYHLYLQQTEAVPSRVFHSPQDTSKTQLDTSVSTVPLPSHCNFHCSFPTSTSISSSSCTVRRQRQ